MNPTHEAIMSDDWYRYFLSQPMNAQPGENFTYSTIGSGLMSRMIRTVSGQDPHDFAMQELFGPLGINDIHWEGYSEQGRGTGLTDWPNPDGDEPLVFGLWLKPADRVKFGELYLNGGVYNGRRILDQSWIDASWENYSHSGNTELFAGKPDSGYGYQWWTLSSVDTKDRSWIINYAAGWGRQHH